MSRTPFNTLQATGAESGDILLGIHPQGNFGLLIQVFEPQLKGLGHRIRGAFRVLHEGKGKYASGIRAVAEDNPFFGKADDFIRLVSRQIGCEDCTHILNANALWKLEMAMIYERIVNVETVSQKAEQIRRCVQCGRIYPDLSLNFCLEDGESLSDELAEVETLVLNTVITGSDFAKGSPTAEKIARERFQTSNPSYEYIKSVVASHPNLELIAHKGFNHRITKSGHVGSIWIIPRGEGVLITATGQAAAQLYREMERLLGAHQREDKKGYRYWQADDPKDVESIIAAWSEI